MEDDWWILWVGCQLNGGPYEIFNIDLFSTSKRFALLQGWKHLFWTNSLWSFPPIRETKIVNGDLVNTEKLSAYYVPDTILYEVQIFFLELLS